MECRKEYFHSICSIHTFSFFLSMFSFLCPLVDGFSIESKIMETTACVKVGIKCNKWSWLGYVSSFRNPVDKSSTFDPVIYCSFLTVSPFKITMRLPRRSEQRPLGTDKQELFGMQLKPRLSWMKIEFAHWIKRHGVRQASLITH